MSLLALVILAALLGLGYAALNFFSVKRLSEGTPLMQEIAAKIRDGASTFLNYEFKILIVVGIVIFAVLAAVVNWQSAVAFVIGALMSSFAGFVGMRIATYANVRVANTANTTRALGPTLKVAFKGGSVMGLCVGGFALLGIFIVYMVFGLAMGQISMDAVVLQSNWLGIEFAPFTMTISCYALGCSVIAMFNRVGGGIYTKAADMGADLVGKTEAGIPEDDPRNPATIADNVGDNVGDVAGLGSDLLESYVGAISSAVILAVHIFLSSEAKGLGMTTEMMQKLFLYPIAFAALGLIACVLGIAFLLVRKLSNDPHKELNFSTWVAAGLTMVFGFVLTWFMFKDMDLTGMSFNLGFASPWIAAAVGIVAGIAIGFLAEYYTSYDYNPTKRIAQACVEGPALTITQGMAVGMRSAMAPVVVLAAATVISYFVSGMFGVAMAAIGMLSFVSATVSVDTYGPISDNAGGIAEMSHLDEKVREITDKLDSVGNTTAAIGKGFAIGSASLATLSLMVAYLYSYTPPSADILLDIINPMTLAGALVGAALPYLFSGILIDAVAKAARKMVDEVRRQFKANPGILAGTDSPDYNSCIGISSKGALAEMKLPALMAIAFPLVTGFLFGAQFVGGALIGATFSAIMLAIFCGNSGGAWDNAKKFIESGGVPGHAKGGETHSAGVVGDTVGDPLKDTVGPSLDILIKIMSVVSLIFVSIFSKFNLLDLIMAIFG